MIFVASGRNRNIISGELGLWGDSVIEQDLEKFFCIWRFGML